MKLHIILHKHINSYITTCDLILITSIYILAYMNIILFLRSQYTIDNSKISKKKTRSTNPM
jgi:hypothetical protein